MKRTHGDSPFERDPVFRGQVYERVRISLIEVYEKVAKSFITVSVKKSRKHSGFVIYSYFKDCIFIDCASSVLLS